MTNHGSRNAIGRITISSRISAPILGSSAFEMPLKCQPRRRQRWSEPLNPHLAPSHINVAAPRHLAPVHYTVRLRTTCKSLYPTRGAKSGRG